MSLDMSETEPCDAPDSRLIESGIKIATRVANCYYFGRVSAPILGHNMAHTLKREGAQRDSGRPDQPQTQPKPEPEPHPASSGA